MGEIGILVALLVFLVFAMIVILASPLRFFAPLISDVGFKKATRAFLLVLLSVLIIAIVYAIFIKIR